MTTTIRQPSTATTRRRPRPRSRAAAPAARRALLTVPAPRTVPVPTPTAEEDARTRLIAEHMALARSLARRYARRGEPMEDLEQVAYLALVKAAEGFEPDRGLAFTTYAVPTILGELKKHFRDHCWAIRPPRRLQEVSRKLEPARQELSQRFGRSPTVAEIAAHLGVDEDEVIEAMDAADAYNSLSLDQPTGDGDDDPAPMVEFLGEEDPGIDLVTDLSSLVPLVRQLDARERRILHLRFYRDYTQAAIGEELGISQMHVSRLLRGILDKLRAGLVPAE